MGMKQYHWIMAALLAFAFLVLGAVWFTSRDTGEPRQQWGAHQWR
jgi:predicted outer membrane lipoprotein